MQVQQQETSVKGTNVAGRTLGEQEFSIEQWTGGKRSRAQEWEHVQERKQGGRRVEHWKKSKRKGTQYKKGSREQQEGALSKRGSKVQEVGWGERVGSWEDGKLGGRWGLRSKR